jgi:hypothetical protein
MTLRLTSHARSLRPLRHEHRAAAFGDELFVLVVHAVMKLDDGRAEPNSMLSIWVTVRR